MLLGPCHYFLGNACGTMSLQFGQCLRDHAVTLLAKFCKKIQICGNDWRRAIKVQRMSIKGTWRGLLRRRHPIVCLYRSVWNRRSQMTLLVWLNFDTSTPRTTSSRHSTSACWTSSPTAFFISTSVKIRSCDPDCALQTRLRRAYFRLVKRWVVERRVQRGRYRFQKDRGPLTTAPFVPGKCWTPVELRGSSVIDWKCLGDRRAVPVSLSSLKCNNILRWTQVLHFNLKKKHFSFTFACSPCNTVCRCKTNAYRITWFSAMGIP